MDQIPCWLTYTSTETHRLIDENLHRSAMYSGMIKEQDLDIVLQLKTR